MMIAKAPPPGCAAECFHYDENMCGASKRLQHCEKIGQRTQEHIDQDKDYGERVRQMRLQRELIPPSYGHGTLQRDSRHTAMFMPWDLEYRYDTPDTEGITESIVEVAEAYHKAFNSRPKPPRGPSKATAKKAKRFNEPPTFWQRMLALLLRFIDRLNGQVGIYEDDKHMPDDKKMATFAELFDEVGQVKEKPRPPRPAENPGYTNTIR